MAKSVNTYLGMTVPISLDGPKPLDQEKTKSLIETLEPYGCFESEAELTHRMEVLATLNTLIKDWIKELSIEKNMPSDVAETIGGHVYTFGSYRQIFFRSNVFKKVNTHYFANFLDCF